MLNSSPCWRYIDVRRPPMAVSIASATSETFRPMRRGLQPVDAQQHLRSAGLPIHLCFRNARDGGHDVAHLGGEIVQALKSCPRISTATRSPPPDPIMRPNMPVVTRVRTNMPGSIFILGRIAVAMSRAERFRSRRGFNWMRSSPRCSPPPRPASAGAALHHDAGRLRHVALHDRARRCMMLSVVSTRTPDSNCTSTRTSPSSACGLSSTPTSGAIKRHRPKAAARCGERDHAIASTPSGANCRSRSASLSCHAPAACRCAPVHARDGPSALLLRNLEDSTGITVSATIKEQNSENETT
jgi:hypothetical protein